MHNNFFLTLPHPRLEAAFLCMEAQYDKIGERTGTIDLYKGAASFEAFLRILSSHNDETRIPANHVPMTHHWLIDKENGAILGTARLRLKISPDTWMDGGNIGYDIAPDYRRQGWATRFLAEMLLLAGKQGLADVIITCDNDNIGSIKTIEKNGGSHPEIYCYEQVWKRRYTLMV